MNKNFEQIKTERVAISHRKANNFIKKAISLKIKKGSPKL